MAEEDVQQEVSNWIDGYRLPDGSLRNLSDEEDGAGAGADGDAEKKDAIDVEEEEGKKKKQMSCRSEMWEHFTKVFNDEGFGMVLVAGAWCLAVLVPGGLEPCMDSMVHAACFICFLSSVNYGD
ncbi:unnamed protein product [Urochloa humidicola]